MSSQLFQFGYSQIQKGSLVGKTALVTGASRGIGAAIARRFAQQGATVAVNGRDKVRLTEVQAEIERAGGRVVQALADVTRFAEIETMRRHVERQLGPVDILIANAGGSFSMPGPMEETSEQGWRTTVDGNLTATFLTIKSFLPGMKERRIGNIITISSAAARRTYAQSPIPYSVAKAGIQMLTQHLAIQTGEYGIRVNCIAPEIILTESNKEAIPAEQMPRLVEMHPIKRLGTPDDVALAAVFLASDQASWITGIILDVAGGAVVR